ncbi:MAG: hypothetical protein GWN00_28580, partial [Aliifodinibius sp.]|nr:hypothetical protein [Fodinibius sp.]NIV14715.1 hypothetical protein [Fodinibius sp.]NIY28615.1 hypothetical protein [Fodinibius sp.]
DLALARAIAKETDTFLSNSLTAVENLATYPDVLNIDKDELEKLFSQIYNVRPDVNLIYRLDENGTMVYHYPEGP